MQNKSTATAQPALFTFFCSIEQHHSSERGDAAICEQVRLSSIQATATIHHGETRIDFQSGPQFFQSAIQDRAGAGCEPFNSDALNLLLLQNSLREGPSEVHSRHYLNGYTPAAAIHSLLKVAPRTVHYTSSAMKQMPTKPKLSAQPLGNRFPWGDKPKENIATEEVLKDRKTRQPKIRKGAVDIQQPTAEPQLKSAKTDTPNWIQLPKTSQALVKLSEAAFTALTDCRMVQRIHAPARTAPARTDAVAIRNSTRTTE